MRAQVWQTVLGKAEVSLTAACAASDDYSPAAIYCMSDGEEFRSSAMVSVGRAVATLPPRHNC
jgi:hypothetical protein